MKKAWKLTSFVTVLLLTLGLVCFGLSLVLGADLVRIADAVFSRYDLTQTYLNILALLNIV
ncbi:MAG: hypothetical protein RR055_07845 [Oscillospiraceae bacterium]